MTAHVQTERQIILNKRLEDVGWGLFLILIGVLWLVPDAIVPQATWIVGAGLIMIGINLLRTANGIPMNRFSATLGILALTAGLASMAGLHLPILPIVLIALGMVILLKPLFVSTT
jgi:hypothetical protein